ncbi:hypothetical protein [Aequorivita marina]|uniref:hypothetical protein n=1 Tax=Aequorivita marina TaxID=3073654 RepID=UPI0028769D5D|nr:hypothetical protein [Aequorivita sp. S2608]MDS1298093.1 hypothetical protein [Aequorivita sp. S2608]
MKICLISFDFWNYDHHIVDALREKDIAAHHINLRSYKHSYPTPFHRIGNFFGKLFLKRNIKKIKREEYIINELAALGKQDQVLVINPEVISIATHQKIKSFTNRYIAYLYDSSKRNPISHLLNIDLFNEVFSFDSEDVATYNLKPLTNYIYFDKKPLLDNREIKYDCFTITSIDERLAALNKISEYFREQQLVSRFLLVGKREPESLHEDIIFSQDRMNQDELHENIAKSRAVLDLLRIDQTGISFRVFEAMGFQKKIITSNKYIQDFDFYNPENILIIDPENPLIPESFLKTAYVPIPQEVYRKYTLEGWVEKVFNLN